MNSSKINNKTSILGGLLRIKYKDEKGAYKYAFVSEFGPKYQLLTDSSLSDTQEFIDAKDAVEVYVLGIFIRQGETEIQLKLYEDIGTREWQIMKHIIDMYQGK